MTAGQACRGPWGSRVRSRVTNAASAQENKRGLAAPPPLRGARPACCRWGFGWYLWAAGASAASAQRSFLVCAGLGGDRAGLGGEAAGQALKACAGSPSAASGPSGWRCGGLRPPRAGVEAARGDRAGLCSPSMLLEVLKEVMSQDEGLG